MKLRFYKFNAMATQGHCRETAMTLTEIMVAMAVFSLAIGAVIYIHLFGLKMNQIVKAKLGASDEARRAISLMVGEIRGCGVVRIGNGGVGSFNEIPPGVAQRGNAIEIYPTKPPDTNNFIRYFRDPVDRRLKRTENGTNVALVVATSITNQMVFTAEDYKGMVLTNNANNRVVGLTLQFYQLEYPTVPVGPGSYYGFYQLRTKITRRALE